MKYRTVRVMFIRSNFFLWLFYSAIITFVSYSNMHAQSNSFRAGASIVDITPFLGQRIVGGYNSPPADYIHDPLQVKTLVLDDGVKELIFVIVDNVSVKKDVFDAAKSILESELNISGADVLMAATHTHSGVSLGGKGKKRKGWGMGPDLDEYQLFVVKRIVDGVQMALANKQPARLAFGTVDVPEHVFNRRWIMKDSVWSPLGEKEIAKMNPGHSNELLHPAGPIDPEVSFIAIESGSGEPLALLANYSLHYVGYVPQGHISADYFSAFAKQVESLLGADSQNPSFVGIMTNGTSGDINNNDYSKPRVKTLPYEKINYVANDLAEKVYREYQQLTFEDDVTLESGASEMTLRVRRAEPELLKNIAEIRDHRGKEPRFHRLEKIYVDRILRMESEYPDSINIMLQTFAINNIGISAIPFEVFAEIGLEIKSSSPFEHTFTIELANGAFGYLPTPEQHKLGGYETWLTTNRVEKQASDKIEKEIQRLFQSIR